MKFTIYTDAPDDAIFGVRAIRKAIAERRDDVVYAYGEPEVVSAAVRKTKAGNYTAWVSLATTNPADTGDVA